MRILLIGGGGFMGPHVAARLMEQGHEVAVLHRGASKARLPLGVCEILGDAETLGAALAAHRFVPEVAVDFIVSSERQARDRITALRGVVDRIVMLSSCDVYRAAGILHGLEPGPLQPVPLAEESELRTCRNVYPPEVLAKLRPIFTWFDDNYDKIPAEQLVMADPEIRGTVLRLPMVYGPGDRLHRLYPIVKRMDDRRPVILFQQEAAAWRAPRGYVENVAAAIALAATSPVARGRIYNIAEPAAYSELEWAQNVARVAGWSGTVLALPKEQTPAHLQIAHNAAQHWTVSSARIREELGYSEPVPFDTALERTIAWERANPPAEIDPKQFDYAAEDAALGNRALLHGV